jgi:hypothetical protein
MSSTSQLLKQRDLQVLQFLFCLNPQPQVWTKVLKAILSFNFRVSSQTHKRQYRSARGTSYDLGDTCMLVQLHSNISITCSDWLSCVELVSNPMPLELFSIFKHGQCYGFTEKGLDILRDDCILVLSPAALFPVHFHICLGCKSESWVVDKRSIFHRDFFSVYCNVLNCSAYSYGHRVMIHPRCRSSKP